MCHFLHTTDATVQQIDCIIAIFVCCSRPQSAFLTAFLPVCLAGQEIGSEAVTLHPA